MNYIKIGTITKPFGLKGELKVMTDSDFLEERFKVGANLFGKFPKGMRKITVTSSRFQLGKPIIVVDNLQDINQISEYLGIDLYIDEDSLEELLENEFYIHELIGKTVQNTNGELLGNVVDVIMLPSSPVLEVKNTDGKKILIPFVNAFIDRIEDDMITIIEIEGLR